MIAQDLPTVEIRTLDEAVKLINEWRIAYDKLHWEYSKMYHEAELQGAMAEHFAFAWKHASELEEAYLSAANAELQMLVHEAQ